MQEKHSPEFTIWLEHSPAVGLWTAIVLRNGREVCVITETTREAVLAEANGLISRHLPKAA